MLPKNKGWIFEIFASIQGESIYIGEQHTFVRFAGCNLACDYCDTAVTQISDPPFCRTETSACSQEFIKKENPLSVEEVVDACKKLKCRTISITGGEPLVQIDFANDLLINLKSNGFRIYLETNGTIPQHLEKLINYCDIVAMDIKLESTSGFPTKWDTHKKFIEIASQKKIIVKVVINNKTTIDEIVESSSLIAKKSKAIPFMLQPDSNTDINIVHYFKLQTEALKYLDDVRIIPQSHKAMGIL